MIVLSIAFMTSNPSFVAVSYLSFVRIGSKLIYPSYFIVLRLLIGHFQAFSDYYQRNVCVEGDDETPL